MGVFLIIILMIVLLWPWIMRWMRAYMMRKAEERLRAMMGMPPRQEEERRQRRRDNERQQRPASAARRGHNPHPARALREVAEDVRYTEYFDYSETSVETDQGASTRREYHERQVEDVKFTEIKTGRK